MMDILFQLGISEDFFYTEDDGEEYDLEDIITEVKSWQ